MEENELIRGRDLITLFRHLKGRFKTAWRATSADADPEYRKYYLDSDISEARPFIFILALIVALFVIGDYQFLGTSPILVGLIILRIVLIAFSVFILRYLKNVPNHSAYDRAIFFYMLSLVIGVLLVNLTRPENFVPHIIVIDMAVVIFYLVMPTQFIFQVIPSIVFSLGEVVIIAFTFHGFMEPGLVTALFSLAFANLVGALSSLQIRSYRWHMHKVSQERKEIDRLAAIGQTAGMIGHDIRNPLQAITSEVYIARQSIVESPMPQEVKAPALESIEFIEEQSDYISKIVSDLQDFARPIKPDIKETDLAKLVTSTFQTVRVPDWITLHVDVQGYPKVKTDPTLIRRALTNLVNNGIQAMSDGGILRVVAYKIDQRVVIEVSDTGNGIPEEVKSRLFTPLLTTKAKGQGLGLPVVKRLVEALGGSLTFESETGKGTKFIITLNEKGINDSRKT